MKRLLSFLLIPLIISSAYLHAEDSPVHVKTCGVIMHHAELIALLTSTFEDGCQEYQNVVKEDVLEICADILSRNDYEYPGNKHVDFPTDPDQFHEVLCQLILRDNEALNQRSLTCPKMQELGSIFTDEILEDCERLLSTES